MKLKILSFLVVLLMLIPIASADGCSWWYGYATDSFSPLSQSIQVCSIDYKNGREDMLISFKTRLKGDKVVWIFPVPSKPEKIEIDILKEFPSYGGYEVKSKAGYTIHEANFPMLMSQVYMVPGLVFWQMGTFGGAPGVNKGVGQDSGVTIHERIEKMGLTTELVTAEDEEGFNRYIQDRGLDLPEESLSIMREYIGEEYSFVVSWISDVEEYRKEIQGDILAVRINFPTNRIYYPLKLTSIYGEKKIPIVIYVNGYVNPVLYESIIEGSRVRYYANDKGQRYTKININTKAYSFTEDLWFSNMPPSEILIADFIATNPILSMIILFAIYSSLASIISGLIVFKGEVPVHRLAALGLANFLTVIGFAITSMLSIKTDDEDKGFLKKFWVILIAALLLPFLVIPLAIFIPILGVLAFFTLVVAFPLIFLAIAIFGVWKLRKKGAYILLFSILFLIITISSNWILVAAFPPEIHGWSTNRAAGFTHIRCLDFQWSSEENELKAIFINARGTPVTITDVYADGDCFFTDESGTGTSLFGGGDNTTVSVAPGDTIQLTCTGDSLEYKEAGDYFQTDITITYTEEVAGRTVTHTESGSIRGIVE